VTYTASASSIYAANAAAYFAFDNTLTGTSSWVSGATPVYSGSTGAYSGNVTTTIQGVGAYTGEWIQLQTSVPLVLQSYRYASGSNAGVLLPKIYFIVASNDGSTWYPLQSTTTTVKPITATWTVCSNNILINYTGTQIVQGNQTGSAITTSYPLYTSQTFQYFRMIINNIWTTGDNSVEIGEFIPNFLGGSITPNLSGLGANTWSNSGVSWVASASSNFAAGYPAYNAFDSANVSWASASTYNTTTGIYTGSVSTTIQNIGLIPGEWLQLQTSLPLVLQSYGFGCLEPKLNPKKYYIIGSNNGSTWYPLQYVEFTTIPFTSIGRNSSTNIIINYTGTQTIQGDQTGSATTTSYAPYVTQAFQYFRIIGVSIWESSPYANMEYREFLPIFTAGQNSSSNYGLTWTPMIQSGSITNEFINDQVALSDSGQYTLFTQQVPPYSRLPLDNSNVDPHGRLTPTTGAGTVTYSSSIVKVGTHSAFFNNTSGAAPSVYLNYTVPAALNKPNQFTMACWTYLTALPGIANATPIGFIDTAGNYGLEFYISPTGTINFYGATTTNGIVNLMTSSTLQINTWSHLVMTYNSQTITLYYNGVSIGSTSATGALQSTGSANLTNLLIGTAVTSSNGLAGYVDDVRIYTTALSATEVLAVYNNPSLTQTVGIASNYLPISSYTKPILSGITGSVVDTAVSQTGREMVLVTSSRLNNLYYSTDFGATFTGLNIGSSALPSGAIPLARLSLDGTAVDVQQALTPATGLGSVTYSSSIVKVGTRSALFSNTSGGTPSNYLNYTVPSALNLPSVLTISCWVYQTAYASGNAASVLTLGSNNSIFNTIFTNAAGVIGFFYGTTTSTGGTNYFSSTTLQLNTWAHIAVTFSVGTLTLYVNGIASSSVNPGGFLCGAGGGNITNLMIGGSNLSAPTNAFAGYIDDVRIYNTALSAADILALSNNAPALANDQSSPMVSCAISNDGSYLTATNSAGTVYRLNSNSSGYSVAVGSEAGAINQAANAIAIGNKAGQVNQSANSIVLNATGSALNTGTSGFYVAPIAGTSGLPMDLLGYGTDSQIVRTGVTVLPGGQTMIIGNPVGNSAPRPPIGPGSINTTIWATNSTNQLSDDGFLRIAAGGGTSPDVKSYIDVTGYSTLADMDRTIVFGTWGKERMRINVYGNVGIGATNPGVKLVVDNGSTAGITSAILASGLTAGSSMAMLIGKSGATNNCGTIVWNHIGDGSANNYFGLGYFNGDNILNIRANGNVGIGTTNPGYLLSLYSVSPGILFTSSSYLSNPWYLFIGTSNGALYLGPNTSSGTPGCNVPIGGSAWQATSDARLKRNVTPIEGSLSRLMGLKPVMFQFKTDSEEETPREGFLAQEVQSVFPSKWIVNENGMPSKQYDDDGNEYDALALCQTNLIPHLVRGIQELKSENDGLKATLADRSAQLDALMTWAKSQGFAG
jgi:hypothetical protein